MLKKSIITFAATALFILTASSVTACSFGEIGSSKVIDSSVNDNSIVVEASVENPNDADSDSASTSNSNENTQSKTNQTTTDSSNQSSVSDVSKDNKQSDSKSQTTSNQKDNTNTNSKTETEGSKESTSQVASNDTAPGKTQTNNSSSNSVNTSGSNNSDKNSGSSSSTSDKNNNSSGSNTSDKNSNSSNSSTSDKNNNSSDNNNQSNPSGSNNSQSGTSGSNNSQNTPSGSNNNQGDNSGSNNNQNTPSGSNNNQGGNSGSNNSQNTPSGSNNNQGDNSGSNNSQNNPSDSNNNPGDSSGSGNTPSDPAENPIEGYTPKFEGDHGGYMNSKYPDRMPKSVIIVPATASKAENLSAQLLQIYIEKEDGYTPEIQTDSIAVGSEGFEISVGKTNRPHGTAKYKSAGSYSIKSYDNGISIVGADDFGLMCGAERFLEACGGYFYMSWDDSLTTNQKQFQIDKTNGISIDYERAFVYTDSDVNYFASSKDLGRLYSVSFGYNGYLADNFCVPSNKPGNYDWYLSAVDKNSNGGFYTGEHAGVPIGLAHTITAEFMEDPDIKAYLNDHPECYSSDSNKQLCLYKATHTEELYALILNHCQKMIDKDYDANAKIQIISISKGDTSYICTCSDCVNNRTSSGNDDYTESYELLELCNKLSTDLHADGKYNNLYIDTLAYSHNYTLKPPVGITADNHVIIRFAPIDRCYSHYIDCSAAEDCRNYRDCQYLKTWCSISSNVWIWDYTTNFANTIAPNANIDVMQHDIKYYKSLGVKGIYFQGNDIHTATNVEFGDIRNYVLGRISQDPTRNYEEELAFFTDVYYGESGKYIREYMKHVEKQSANHQNNEAHSDEFNHCFQNMYSTYADAGTWSDHSHKMSAAEVEACENLWNTINAIAANDTDEHKARIKKLECSWRMIKSTLKVKEFSNPSTYANENAKLINDIKATGATKFSILGSVKMSDCTHTSHLPDNWAYSDDGTD